MSDFPSDTVKAALTEVEADEEEMIEIAAEMLQAYGGAVYGLDFLANAAVNRALALSSGFRMMICEQNLICAGALLRLQLDTALRFFAGFIVAKPHEFALEVLGGKHIDRMKDKDGSRMTDRHLVTQMAKKHPWVETVYEQGSDYVHMSRTHILSTINSINLESGKAGIRIGRQDQPLSDDIYFETINPTFPISTLQGLP